MEKIIFAGLTTTGRGYDSKLDILEVVVNVSKIGKTYQSEQYLIDIINNMCVKCQEERTPIKFPSLIIWITMYYIRPVRDPEFDDPT